MITAVVGAAGYLLALELAPQKTREVHAGGRQPSGIPNEEPEWRGAQLDNARGNWGQSLWGKSWSATDCVPG